MSDMIGLFALKLAMQELFEMDDKIVAVGEDIGPHGGAWAYFDGLFARYGRDRVIQTPISENGYAGFANGMAYGGFRPIVEFMYADFGALAFDSIVNMAAKARFNSNGKLNLPITYIFPEGSGSQSGSQHTQHVEAWFANVPGLKIVAPTTPADLRYFLKAAVLDDDPVLFIFSRLSAMRGKGSVDENDKSVPPLTNAARVVKEGSGLTVVAWHRCLIHAKDAAQDVEAATGKTVEIIDPRVLAPLDLETILVSVRKTGRVLVAHDAPERGSWAALISGLISENAFESLKKPVARIGGLNMCTPPGALEECALPQKGDIKAAMLKLLS
ncbi:MAG: hypothetical protein LBS64_05380 [Spirochaetaceae bacterium]|jgi:pyruvate dehydrogenase E1 component beta subunit|nr:hypothetical protein [Spirochaetaceae bacterium]